MGELEIDIRNRAMELIAAGLDEDEAYAQAIQEFFPLVPKRKPRRNPETGEPIPQPSGTAEFLSEAFGTANRIAEQTDTDPETAWQEAVTETLRKRRTK